jgi:hypothetical protein
MVLRDYHAPEAYAELSAYTLLLGDVDFIVVQRAPGVERNTAIEEWAASTLVAFWPHRTALADLLSANGIGTPG